MHLTSPVLPWLFIIVAVVVFALLVFGRPRFARDWAKATSRGIGILLLNGLVIIVCFLMLNNANLFYTSWSDIVGGNNQHTTTQRGALPTPGAIQHVPGPNSRTVAGPRSYSLPSPGQRMQTYTVHDSASHASMHVLVYLPAGYKPTSAKRYPVILGLHGFPSVPKSFTKINFLSTADRLEASGKLAKSIFVIPQINNPNTLDTECVNGPTGDPQTDTWLSKEVPKWTVRHFHVQTSRESWATLGYSFGGWCAASLTLRHPASFGAAISFAGYFEPDFGKNYHPLDAAQLRQYDLIRRVHTAPPPVAIWLFASHQDSLAYPTSHRFFQAARSPASVTATFVAVGGHRNVVYEPYTAPALTWLAKTLPGFHTIHPPGPAKTSRPNARPSSRTVKP